MGPSGELTENPAATGSFCKGPNFSWLPCTQLAASTQLAALQLTLAMIVSSQHQQHILDQHKGSQRPEDHLRQVAGVASGSYCGGVVHTAACTHMNRACRRQARRPSKGPTAASDLHMHLTCSGPSTLRPAIIVLLPDKASVSVPTQLLACFQQMKEKKAYVPAPRRAASSTRASLTPTPPSPPRTENTPSTRLSLSWGAIRVDRSKGVEHGCTNVAIDHPQRAVSQGQQGQPSHTTNLQVAGWGVGCARAEHPLLSACSISVLPSGEHW